jgi:hypothetical protein
MREVRGLLIPDHIEVPDANWYRMEFGDSVTWDIDRPGHEYMARQHGMDSLESSVAGTGTADGVLYATVEAELVVTREGKTETYCAVSGADATSQQVRDPEHVWSVAESRAVKRVVKRALGIRGANQSLDDADAAGQSETTQTTETDDTDTGGTSVPTYPDPQNNDDDIDW